MTDDLDRLLPLIDEFPPGSHAEVTDAEARVWARITAQETLVRNGRISMSARRSGRNRWVRPLSLAAVVAGLVAGLVVVAFVRRDAAAPADVSSTTASVVDRSEACARFRSDGTPFAELDAAIARADDDALQRTVDALDQLRADLGASGVDQADLDVFGQLRGGVAQAKLLVSEGDVGSALLALEFANRAYTSSELFADRCLG